jgi:hypothetical protein
MKKIFALSIIAAVFTFTACNKPKTEAAATGDSTATVVAPMAEETAAPMATDTTAAATADTAKKMETAPAAH